MRTRIAAGLAGLAFLAAAGTSASAADKFIVLQSTTSTQDSGLFEHLLPIFTKKTGIEVRVVAVGTGQAIKNGENGDGDVLLVHSRPDEDRFIAQGFGVNRHDVMYNDFVVVGPSSDPASAAAAKDVTEAFRKIAAAKAPFASRGDDSGTHKKELSIWKTAGIDVKAASGAWYRDTGSGMGATLNAASSMNAYTLADRATWAAFGNKGDLKIVVEGSPDLLNPYGVMLVNPARHPSVKADLGQTFIDWLVSDEGRAAIAGFKVGGQQLFFPAPMAAASVPGKAPVTAR